MNKIQAFLAGIILPLSMPAQSAGDTIVVHSLHHGSATRDTMVDFPSNPSLTFSSILMKYNMRCKDGKISDASNRNRGCGEWDYSCNTYIHDSSRVDSLLSKQVSHIVSPSTGNVFPYTNNVVNSYYIQYQKSVQLDSIISENSFTVGSGSQSLSTLLPVDKANGKSQYLFRASELVSGGVTGGYINAIYLNSLGGNSVQNLRIRMKASTDSVLDASSPGLDSLGEVFFDNFQFISGLNRLQFHSPFSWNGTSGILIEFSFTGKSPSGTLAFAASATPSGRAIFSAGDAYFNFNSINYVESVNFKGIGASMPRTVEAWIKTAAGGGEIVSWGNDVASGKWNLRLESTGRLMVEVNGGHKYGTKDLRDNKWHHVACTFNGSNVTEVKLYVDGLLETTGGQTSKTVNTDTASGINVRISRGTNNRYFSGIIDEVRIWDTALTDVELQNWNRRRVNSSHPQSGHLLALYSFDEGSGTSVYDSSGAGHHCLVMQGNQWSQFSGVNLFKGFETGNLRPNITFLKGSYLLTITTDTVYDTIPQLRHSVLAYTIFPMTGGLKNDSIASNFSLLWHAGYEYVFDTSGQKLDSVAVTPQATINITDLVYYRRYPMKFEIMSFVTPYGIGLDLGMAGKTWTFDLTDFSPVLRGKKRLSMEWGGQNQEEMDIQFYFIVGSPPRNIIDIKQVWKVTKPSYSAINLNSEFEARQVPLNASGKAFAIRSSITGHGQEGEFIPKNHYLDVNNNAYRASWQVWKECAGNPVYPQGGTWIYDRAGWCPGAPTDLRITDISQHVSAGGTVRLDYGMQSASGESNYIVSHQLVTYGPVNKTLDASLAGIMAPTSAVEYERTNSICGNPTVIIRNTGSSELNNATITYWINGAQTKQSFNWTGSLDFLEEEVVVMPGDAGLWKWMLPAGNEFHAEISAPNGGADQNIYNNSMTSSFSIPEVLPGNFVVWFRTNKAASENSFFIEDMSGNAVLSRSGFQNNTEYRDTLDLLTGCYRLVLEDSDHDGISFWANSDGNGFMIITDVSGNVLRVLEPDFGAFSEFHFTTDFPLSHHDVRQIREKAFNVFPNPATTHFTLDGTGLRAENITIVNSSGQVLNLPHETNGNKLVYRTNGLPGGLYLIRHDGPQGVICKRLLVE